MQRNLVLKSNFSSLVRLLLVVLLAQLLLSCAQQSSTHLPGIKADTQGVYRPGKFIWMELVTEDAAKARQFYSELFGWTFAESDSYSDYSTISHRGAEIGGLLSSTGSDPAVQESRWLATVSVDDVDQIAREVEPLDGKVLYGPVDAGKRGRLAQVEDAQGADFIILRTPHGDPARYAFAQGYPIWRDIFTRDREATKTFYMNLLGYSSVEQTGAEGIDSYFTLGNTAVAGMVKLQWDDTEPTWLTYIGVDDLRASVLKAIELGGTLIATHETAAIILDPGGAAIGLHLLPKEGAK